MQKIFDNVTNLFLILAVSVLGYHYVLKQQAATRAASPSIYAAGDPLPALAGVRYADAAQTLVLAVNSTCRYCTESMPFYQKLQVAAVAKGVRIVVVTITDEAAQAEAYLGAHGVTADAIVPKAAGPTTGLKVKGTPTLILTDAGGTVKQEWIGRLTPAREAEVFRAAGLD